MSILPTLFVVLAALTPQEKTQFQSGLDAYWKGDYEVAATVFGTLSETQPDAYSVWYNYGTALAELGSTGRAVYAFERALMLQPSSADAVENLAHVKRKMIDGLSETQQEEQLVLPAIERDSSSLFRQYSTTTLNVSFGLCWLLFFGALVVARASGRARHRTVGFFFSLVFFLLSLGVATLRLGRNYWVDDSVKAIVVLTDVTARQGPGGQYRRVARVLDGVKVTVLGTENEWTLIELSAGRTAWIESRNIAQLPSTL